MAIEPKIIPLDEFSKNLIRIFDRILANQETVVVENNSGQLIAVSPAPPPQLRPKSEEDLAAFRSAAGSWSDVDTDTLLANIYASRKLSSRPPVAL